MTDRDTDAVPPNDSNVTAYLQNQFGAEYEDTEAARKAVTGESQRRRWVAYGLKAVAALGGLVLAAGLLPPYSQALGFAIAAAVAIDGLFSNHLRLITTVKASQAYRRLLRSVARTHRRELGLVLAQKQTDAAAAEKALNDLNSRLLAELHSGSEEIEAALDAADVKALTRLSLDTEKDAAKAD